MRPCVFVVALLAAGCMTPVGPVPELGETVQNECSSYCQDGEFFCPSNPLMECYWVCTVTCTVCDDGTTCNVSSPSPQSMATSRAEASSFCHKYFSCDGGDHLYSNSLACHQAPECEGQVCEAVFVGCDPLP